MNKNNKVLLVVIIFTIYILMMMLPYVARRLGGLGIVLIIIIVRALRSGEIRHFIGNFFRRMSDSFGEKDVWEDNRDEAERIGRQIHDYSAILKKLYDAHYRVLEDGLFARYHDAMFRISKGENSEDLLEELERLVRAFSTYEDPVFRAEQEQRRFGNERSYSNAYQSSYQENYRKNLFHPFLGKTKHFKDCEDFDSAKKKYYRLMKETHPDNSASDERLCAELNSEFDSIQEYFHRK